MEINRVRAGAGLKRDYVIRDDLTSITNIKGVHRGMLIQAIGALGRIISGAIASAVVGNVEKTN